MAENYTLLQAQQQLDRPEPSPAPPPQPSHVDQPQQPLPGDLSCRSRRRRRPSRTPASDPRCTCFATTASVKRGALSKARLAHVFSSRWMRL